MKYIGIKAKEEEGTKVTCPKCGAYVIVLKGDVERLVTKCRICKEKYIE